MERALVLSSGGVDSTTCVGLAIERFGKDNVSTVSVSYGQKHRKELECAQNIADYYDVKHYELDLSQIMRYSNCSLLSHSTEDIDSGTYEEGSTITISASPIARKTPSYCRKARPSLTAGSAVKSCCTSCTAMKLFRHKKNVGFPI